MSACLCQDFELLSPLVEVDELFSLGIVRLDVFLCHHGIRDGRVDHGQVGQERAQVGNRTVADNLVQNEIRFFSLLGRQERSKSHPGVLRMLLQYLLKVVVILTHGVSKPVRKRRALFRARILHTGYLRNTLRFPL